MIRVRFQGQNWVGYDAVDVGEPLEVDVTKRFFELALNKPGYMHELAAHPAGRDTVIDPSSLGWGGQPFSVDTLTAVPEAFGVDAISEIDRSMLLVAASRVAPENRVEVLTLEGSEPVDSDKSTPAGDAIARLKIDFAMLRQQHSEAFMAIEEAVESIEGDGGEQLLARERYQAIESLQCEYGASAANDCDDDEAQEASISAVEAWVTANVSTAQALAMVYGVDGTQLVVDKAAARFTTSDVPRG